MKRGFLKKIHISREQVCCLIGAAALALISTLVPRAGTISDGYTITRSDPGGSDAEYELKLGGIGSDEDIIRIRVSSRQYSEEEAYSLFTLLMEELEEHIVGNNKDLDCIDSDLSFPTSVAGYEGIKVSIYPADSELIGYDGSVHNDDLDEAVETYLRVTLRTGSYSQTFALPVRVVPAPQAEIKARLVSLIEKADEEQIESAYLTLPESFEGIELSYGESKDTLVPQILLGGICAAALVGLRPRQEQRKKEKLREDELLRDYSEMVSRLIVYMGAGLSVRNAWREICEDYREEMRSTGSAAVYEEMLATEAELERGVAESEAYQDFARRTGQKCYMKLVSILEQNLQNGDARSEAALNLEMQEAFEQRKNIARRLGEQASTKLMLPLMISLLTVLIITAAPALMSLG